MTSTITVNIQSPLRIDTTATFLTDQFPSLCANACFAARAAFGTTPYYTLDVPRSVKFFYSEERAHPRPIITADVARVGITIPTQYTLTATLGGTAVQFLNGDTKTYYAGSSARVRLAQQIDARSYATGIYPLVVTVTGSYADGTSASVTYSRPLVIVNEAHSPLGRGWTVAGVQRVYVSGGAYLVTDGTGDAVYFPALDVQAHDYTTLRYNSTSGYYVREYPDSSRVYFTAAGYDTAHVDRLGFRTRFGYSGTRLLSISDPQRYLRGNVGTYLLLGYGTYGLASVAETGGTNGRVTSVTVASDSTLRTITDPDGAATRYAYDASGRLVTIVNRRSDTTTYNYNANSWALSSVDLPRVAVDIGSGNTTLARPRIQYTPWQTLGIPTAATSSAALATPVDSGTVKATITDPTGRATTYTVNRYGQPVVIRDVNNDTTKVSYNTYLPYRVIGPTALTDTLDYATGMPFIDYLRMAGDSLVQYHYGAKNQIDSVWGPGRRAEYRFLDPGTGRVDSIRYAGVNTLMARYTYDASNRVVSATDPAGHKLTYTYDAVTGNRDSVTSPGGLFGATQFDAYGRDSSFHGSGSSRSTVTLYDQVNRPVKSWHTGLPAGFAPDTVLVKYDSLFPVRVQAPGGQVYKRSVNALGRVVSRFDAFDTTKTATFRYDSAGRPTSVTNRRGQRLDRTYDVLGRLATQSVNGVVRDSMTYSVDGRIVRAVRIGVSRDSLFINPNGQTDSIVRRLGVHRYVIRYTYAFKGSRMQRVVTIGNDAGVSFAAESTTVHDTAAAVRDSITLTGGGGAGTTVIHRNADGLRTFMQRPGVAPDDSTSYTAQHQLIRSAIRGPLLRDSLTRQVRYDSLGRIVYDHRWGANGKATDRDFLYDSLGRLVKVVEAVDSGNTVVIDTLVRGYVITSVARVWSLTRDSAAYDASGNRLFPGATYSTRGNRLLTGPAGTSYTYDADGNMVTRTRGGVTDSLFWSVTGQLDSVASGGSTGLRRRYEYNSFGQLVRRSTKVGAGSYTVDRYFLWDGSQMIAELTGSGGRIAQYVYTGTDQPFAIVTDSGTTSLVRYYYQDPMEGDLTAVLRDSLSLRQYTQYSAWGQQLVRPVNTLADTNRLGWKGLIYEGDSTRLYYMRNRWYDPVAQRFVSEDPIRILGGLNLYAFAENDPIKGTDPSGLSGTGWVGPRQKFLDGGGGAGNGGLSDLWMQNFESQMVVTLSGGAPNMGWTPEFEAWLDSVTAEPKGGPPHAPAAGRSGKPNTWVNKGPAGPGRRNRWVPRESVPTKGGGQPGASWDPAGGGHWDVDDGEGTRRRYAPDGTEVDHDGNPIFNEPSLIERIQNLLDQPMPEWFPELPPLPPLPPGFPLPLPVP